MHPDPSFPALHGRPDHGWVNDPNGLAVLDGRYHVFFQYNPDRPVHERIHWGHASSDDLLRWREEPIALAPRDGAPDERGCWSGCLVDDAGTPTVLYTAVSAAGPGEAGVVLATSDRAAIEWQPRKTIIPHTDEPHDIQVRDPYVFVFDGRRYAVQGGGAVGEMPRIVLYACEDLREWTLLGNLLTPDDPAAAAYGEADVWECPNLFEMDGRWVLIISPLTFRESGAQHGEVFALIGQLEPDRDSLSFRPEATSRLDDGVSFYAPQVLVDGERRLIWGWTRDEGRSAAQIAQAGWTGALTLPRELRLEGDALRSAPARELEGLRRERVHPVDGVIDIGAFEIEGTDAGVRLILEGERGSETIVDVDGSSSTDIRILVDGSVIEVFVEGTVARTLRAYPDTGSRWRIRGGAGLRLWRLGLE
ncbi:glycoside hydrolase family 32 protein [Microbacterium sp. DT81.1]|uniref:glycoside hydrolase family 32 protein n=1 Tax=Microbacterium sp. DT81.1 TaxID=3393413 RepID=UPI003CEFA56F